MPRPTHDGTPDGKPIEDHDIPTGTPKLPSPKPAVPEPKIPDRPDHPTEKPLDGSQTPVDPIAPSGGPSGSGPFGSSGLPGNQGPIGNPGKTGRPSPDDVESASDGVRAAASSVATAKRMIASVYDLLEKAEQKLIG